MGEVTKNFIIQFHQLSGDTLKERHRNLFKLLHQHKLALLENKEELLFISKNLKAKNHLEKIFRIDFLIYFKIFEELYSEFTSGNEIALSKLAKQDWFFQKAFQDLSASDFVNTILPTVGHNVKLKILRKLALKEEKCDEIFEAIKQKYGLFLAVNILPKCSVSQIQTVFKEEYVKLTEIQLKKIFNKEPKLICLYIEERTKHEGGTANWIHNQPILVYIAQKNPKLFSELFQKYLFSVNLRRRTCKKLIAEEKDTILADRKAWIKILNTSKLVRKLGNHLKDLFFVENKDGYRGLCYWECLLAHYPKKHQFNIYKTSFNDVHYYKFGDTPDSVPENILKIIPNADERQKYAKIKFEENGGDTYLKYFAPKYLLQEFMEKLPQTTANERSIYVDNISRSCILDDDVDTLLKLCQLVAVRFKNDVSNIRSEFYYNLGCNKVMVDKFSDQHWQYLLEIMATEEARNESLWQGRKIRFLYVEHLLKNNQPIDEFIFKCNDDFIHDFEYGFYPFDDKKIIAQVLHTIAQNGLYKLSRGDKDKAASYDCRIATIIKKFNEDNPKHFIHILENSRILASVLYILKKGSVDLDFRYKPGIGYMLCQKNNSPDFDEMRKLYFSSFKQFGCEKTCFWFLKYDPKTFKEHYDQFFASDSEACGIKQKRCNIIKKFTHLGLDEATINFCKLKLQAGDYENKSKLVKALAILSDPDDYIQFINKSYLPTDATVDLTDEDTKEKYLIQGNLVKNLHFTNAPAAIAPLVLQFCKGDYLRHALGPLFSLEYRLPEHEAMKVAQQLFEMKAVSTRKHAINLSCEIFDQTTVHKYLENAPIPIFKAALKYFVKNPSETSWNLLEKQILETESKDLQIFKSVINVTIPYQYKAKYFETICSVLNKHKDVQITKLLFENVDTNIDLKPEFAYRIIKNYIFKIEEANTFIANLLININDDGKFDCMREILTEVKSTQVTVYKKLDGFIKCLSEVYMESKKVDIEFAKKFSNMFKSIFRPHEAFEEYIIVDLWLLKGETTENSANILLNTSRSLCQRYGTSAAMLFAIPISKHILPHLYKNEEEVYQLIRTLLKKIQQEHLDDYMWIIMLLPKSVPVLTTSFFLHKEIKTVLSGIENDAVQLNFNLYLKSETEEGETNKDYTWC